MGWQGRLRDSKAMRYFTLLPDGYDKRYKLIAAYSWRSDSEVWFELLDHTDNSKHTLRMNRKTGRIISQVKRVA